jgi:hypothetical protein
MQQSAAGAAVRMKLPELHAAHRDALSPVVSNPESTNRVAADTEPDEDSLPRDSESDAGALTCPSLRGLSRGWPSADRIQPMEPTLKSL